MATESQRAAGVAFFARLMGIEEAEVAAALAATTGERMAEDTLRATGAAWTGPALAARDRSLVVLSSLIALGGFDARLRSHLRLARENGVTQEELEEVVALLAVYVGFPRASAAGELVHAGRALETDIPMGN